MKNPPWRTGSWVSVASRLSEDTLYKHKFCCLTSFSLSLPPSSLLCFMKLSRLVYRVVGRFFFLFEKEDNVWDNVYIYIYIYEVLIYLLIYFAKQG